MIREVDYLLHEGFLPEDLLTADDDSVGPADHDPAVSAALRDVLRLSHLGASHDVLAEAVASGLAALEPTAAAAVVAFVALPQEFRPLGFAGEPALRPAIDDQLKDAEFLLKSARLPGTVHRTAQTLVRAEKGRGGLATTVLHGVAVPIGDSALWVLLVSQPSSAATSKTRDRLHDFASGLRSLFRPEIVPRDAESIEDTVLRAKYEWEMTVDALPHVVCLLDPAGRVVRANRAIERWSLGSVVEARGRHFHDLLHPGCEDPRCKLLVGVSMTRRRMQTEQRRAYEFQLDDPQLQRVVRVRVGRMRQSGDHLRAVAMTSAVLILQDVTALESAKARLEELNHQLEALVAERTQELADANRDLQNEVTRCRIVEDQLRDRTAELSQLSANLMNTQEQERKRISRELHDSIGQSLTALKYRLERAIELERKGHRAALTEELERTVHAVQETMDEVRTVALDLRPSVLDNLGAASAVAWFCRNFAASYPDILVAVSNVTARDDEVPQRLETTIFRSLQELLNNVARHAKATRVTVTLRREPEEVVLEVSDNGVGLQAPLPKAAGPRGGHGTRNLKERAEMTGGRFELQPGVPGGVVASIRWKLQPGEMTRSGGEPMREQT